MPAVERVLALVLVLLSAWAVLALLRVRPTRLDEALAVALAVGSLWWLFASPAYEGPGILALTATRGLTVADLGVPPGLFLALGVLVKRRRPPGSPAG